tara:strand:+ start:739 stop:1002 length:264 start_codon:yes stop_codon:yes gene_type:complete
MSEIKEVEFVEQKEYNVLQLNDFGDCLIGITHEARPRAIHSLDKILKQIMKQKKCKRDTAFKHFELEMRMPLFEQRNAPVYLNDISA